MSTHSRPERVAQLIQQKLGEIFARGLKDPRVGFVTITGVKMSADLRDARVYWAVHGDEKTRTETKQGIEAARGFLRREVGRGLELRLTPDLHFTYDEAIERGSRIEELLREVKTHEAVLADEKEPAGAAEPTEGEPAEREPAERKPAATAATAAATGAGDEE